MFSTTTVLIIETEVTFINRKEKNETNVSCKLKHHHKMLLSTVKKIRFFFVTQAHEQLTSTYKQLNCRNEKLKSTYKQRSSTKKEFISTQSNSFSEKNKLGRQLYEQQSVCCLTIHLHTKEGKFHKRRTKLDT